MATIGADLGALSLLAKRFETAGTMFQQQAAGISSRVARSLEEFVAEMGELDSQARELSIDIAQDMSRLNAQAESTTWTGANRGKMNNAVAALDDEIVRIKAAIDGFAEEASAVVNGSLSTAMTELGEHARASGAKALEVSTNFGAGVAAQRASFDQVMNG